MEILISSLVFMAFLATAVTVVTVIKVKKDPERFMEHSESVNKQISEVKKAVTGNSISWEDAKKQAALELEIEESLKAERKASKRARKNGKQDNNY